MSLNSRDETRSKNRRNTWEPGIAGQTLDLNTCAMLRAFLPQHPSAITAEGTVPFDGLHYTHELLLYWPGSPVTLCRSPYAEATAWIYLGEEILCQAQAQELRRHDGSYRPFR